MRKNASEIIQLLDEFQEPIIDHLLEQPDAYSQGDVDLYIEQRREKIQDEISLWIEGYSIDEMNQFLIHVRDQYGKPYAEKLNSLLAGVNGWSSNDYT